MDERIVVRSATEAEANLFARLWNTLGWECSPTYPGTIARALEGGFLIICVGDKPVGCIAAVLNEGNSPAFIGYFSILTEHQGKGYGKILWTGAIDWLKTKLSARERNVVIALDTVPQAAPLYLARGFRPSDCCVSCWHRDKRLPADSVFSIDAPPEGLVLRDVQEASLEDLASFDKQCSGLWRPTLLKQLLASLGWLGWIIHDSKGYLSAFLVARPTSSGYSLGPLHASSTEEARVLLSHAVYHLPKAAALWVEVWKANPAAERLFEELGFIEDREHGFQRMWFGNNEKWEPRHSWMYAVLDSGLG